MVDGSAAFIHCVLQLKAFVVKHGLETLVDLDFALSAGHLPEARVLFNLGEAVVAAHSVFGSHGDYLGEADESINLWKTQKRFTSGSCETNWLLLYEIPAKVYPFKEMSQNISLHRQPQIMWFLSVNY